MDANATKAKQQNVEAGMPDGLPDVGAQALHTGSTKDAYTLGYGVGWRNCIRFLCECKELLETDETAALLRLAPEARRRSEKSYDTLYGLYYPTLLANARDADGKPYGKPGSEPDGEPDGKPAGEPDDQPDDQGC